MGKYSFAVGHAPRPGRRVSRFRLGTCLTGTAALLLIGTAPAAAKPMLPLVAPLLARTPRPIRTMTAVLPQDLSIRADRSTISPPGTASIPRFPAVAAPRAAAAAAPIHDPTALSKTSWKVSGDDVTVAAGTIVTANDYEHGIDTQATRTTSVEVDGVTTSGTRADGVHAVGYGDISIKAGNASTSGYRSNGIYASTNLGGATGGIKVTADTVSTSGVASTGIAATAYHGGVSIQAGSVKTSGYGSDGINAWSYDENADVTAGSVMTSGDAGRGVVAYSGAITTIAVGSVATTGAGLDQDSNAAAIKAVGAAIDVRAENVSTRGDHSAGIYAISNRTHDSGQVERDITVTAGTVTTDGDQSDGIDAINYGEGGKTSVVVDKVSTGGDASWGIYAAGLGDVAVNAGTIETKGASAAGVVALSVYGNIDVTADAVTVAGAHSNAINAVNYSQNGATTIKVGSISTQGDGSSGIYVGGSNGYQGANHVVTVDAGSISTNGDAAAGLVILTGGAVDANVGDITIEGPRSRGVLINTEAGDIDLVAGNIVTKGEVGLGRDAVGLAISNNNGDVSAGIKSISTIGDHSAGILANGYASNQSFVIQDGITTRGYHADGAFAVIDHGNLSIDSGTITTSGAASNGARAYVSSGDTDIHIGALSTLGEGSNGISLQASSFDGIAHRINVDLGTVITAGDHASGVFALAQGGDIGVTAGSITTTGASSAGISLAAGNGIDADGNPYGGNVAVHVGTVTTTGDGSIGIDTMATKSTSITADSITTSGSDAAGIHAYGSGPMTIEVGSVATTGDRSYGVYALTAIGNVGIKADSVSATGFLSHGIRAASYGGDVAVDVNSVTGGVGTGIDVRAGYGDHGNAAVTAGTIVTGGAGIVALAGDDVKIDVGSVTTHSGTQDAGTQLGQAIKAVAHGGIDITAGTVTTTGYSAEGVYAVATSSSNTGREPGDITIDVGSVTTSGVGSTGVFAINTGYADGGQQSVKISAGAVSTSGDNASGIYGVGPNVVIAANGAVSTKGHGAVGVYAAALGGDVTVTAGDVRTQGDAASAVRGYSSGDKVEIATTGTITTAGTSSYGVLAFGTADLAVTNSGSIATSGEFARGVYTISRTGLSTINNSGAISTSGKRAEGIRAISLTNGVAVTSTGSVTTTGDSSTGIFAVRDRDGRGDPSSVVTVGEDSTVTVSASSVSTTGAQSSGVLALNYAFGGQTTVKVDSITTTGASSAGVVVRAFGDTDIQARDIRSSGIAVYSQVNGDYVSNVTITGSAISTDNSAVVVATSSGTSVINVSKGAKVIGGGTRDPIYGGGDGIYLSGYAGTATINNAGTIATTAADGYAISSISGLDYYTNTPNFSVTINNSGTLLGAVKLDVGEDVLNNSGVFVATKNSDFGGGGDRFVNTGTLLVAPGVKPGRVSFLNLASFENKGGLVDLRNGVAGDVLSLSGSYIGTSGAHLALDVIGTKADMLTVTGAATGKTGIVLDMLPADARLLATPLTLVKVGTGSATDAFSLVNADVGLIRYGVSYDAASGSFGLTGRAGAAVYRTLNVQRAERAIWNRAADGWDAHMAERRDAGDGFGSKLWGQMYGGVDMQQGHRSIDGSRIETGFRQDYYGAQLGLDLAGKDTAKGGMMFGLTGSYISSDVSERASGDRTQFDTLSFGGYASYRSGPFFANLLGQYGHDWTNVRNLTLGYTANTKGDSYGADLQVGARFGSERLHIEPLASIAYVRSDIDDLHALGQTIDFDRYDGLRGKIGGRIGSTTDLGGSKTTFYVQGRYVHEFKGKDGIDFLSGGTNQAIAGVRPGDYGQGALGVNIVSAGRASGFIEGNADLGATKGGGGRIGISFKM